MVEASTVVCWLKNIMTVVTHVHMVTGGDGTVKSNVTSQWARAPRRRVYSACAAFTWHAHPSYRLDSSSNYRPILVLPQIKKTSHTVSTLLLSTAWPAWNLGEHGIPMFTKTDSCPAGQVVACTWLKTTTWQSPPAISEAVCIVSVIYSYFWLVYGD